MKKMLFILGFLIITLSQPKNSKEEVKVNPETEKEAAPNFLNKLNTEVQERLSKLF